jgi:hypothetical protein
LATDADLLVVGAPEDHHQAYLDVPVKRAIYHGLAASALVRAATGARLLVVGDRGRSTA